ncbi:integrase, partial [Hydrogenibacillus schlegelii]|uniref:hypothetical protein n=1 Tax=Hydrogenibacillus schlegelii TaxID=1484 RepID=UPI0034C05635
GQAPARVAGYRHVQENCTPRFPEVVIAALLAWSLRYVTMFADDILAARHELDRLEARRDRLAADDAGLPDADRRQRRRARLNAYFDRRRREGRGVPIWGTAHNGKLRIDPGTGAVTPPINAHLLHLHAGIDVQAEPGAHFMLTGGEARLIDAVAAELGVEVGGMDTPITI